MKLVSIITPVFKGGKYLNQLKNMIEVNAKILSNTFNVEWIIVNDFPQDMIRKVTSIIIDIVVINNSRNFGIQGARAIGLRKSTGDYVLFLDQDDWISPNWVRSQLEHIGEADACVCNATRDGRKFYDTMQRPSLDVCITKEYNISDNWGFIPGQVLVKREAIPELWKKRWLKWNCCDDYFLWLLMFANGCTFVSNHDVLYDHRSTGSNQSMNTFEWYKSTQELMEILEEENILSETEMQHFKMARQKQMDESFLDKTWCNIKFDLLDRLLRVYEKKLKISDSIHLRFGAEPRIAIYGTGIGWHVYERLKAEGINIECFIDQRAKEIELPVPAYVREEIPMGLNLVINTLIKDENDAKEYIEGKYPDMNVLHIKELLALTLQGDN